MCQAGFSLSDSQCAACTGGQALDVCTTYGGDNSCECTSCANGYRLEEGACVECKMLNPNCKDFKANSCDCATCEAGYSGDNCELVSRAELDGALWPCCAGTEQQSLRAATPC